MLRAPHNPRHPGITDEGQVSFVQPLMAQNFRLIMFVQLPSLIRYWSISKIRYWFNLSLNCLLIGTERGLENL